MLLKDFILRNLFTHTGEYYLPGVILAVLGLLGLILIVGLFHLLSHLNSKKIKARKTFSILIWSLLLSFGVFFAAPAASFELIFLALLPVSYILSHFFIFSKRKLISEIFFAILFLAVIFMQVWYLK